MKSRRQWCAVFTAAMLLSGCMAMTSFGAGRNKITTVRLEVKDKMQPGSALGEDDELSVETKAENYSVGGWEIENTGYTWSRSDKPRVKVTLVTEDDNYFSVAKDQVKLKGDEATVYSVNREEPQVLEIVLNLRPMYQRVGPVEDAWLEGTVAAWTPAIGADHYDLYLYRDSRPVGSRKTTEDTSFDFGTAMHKEGEYYYKVRAVGADGAEEGKFTESESLSIGSSGHEAVSGKGEKPLNNSECVPGQWLQNQKGWRWTAEDGTKPADEWALIDEKWYYFGADGYMVTGWIQWEEQWYYLGPDGDLKTNDITPDGYLVDESGARIW